MKNCLFAIIAFGALLLLNVSCKNIEHIKYDPPVTPNEWCNSQPCVQIGNITVSQPSSSAIVYILAITSIILGLRFIRNNNNQKSRAWWGISLIIGGLGALLAGTSYQAFGYELKCAGKEYCSWTNWWELWYEILTITSAGALLVAVAKACFVKTWQKYCTAFALINTLAYVCVIAIGVYFQNQFLLSFDLMVCFITPIYITIMVVNVTDYFRTKKTMLKHLIMSWIILFSTLVMYYLYMTINATEALWINGLWFSENDVLHIGMIVWLIYIDKSLGKSLKDLKFEM